jgi:hypothetical protein
MKRLNNANTKIDNDNPNGDIVLASNLMNVNHFIFRKSINLYFPKKNHMFLILANAMVV